MGRSPEVSSRLLFERGPWDALDSEFEKRIPGDSPAEHADCLARMVAAGRARVYHVIEDGKRVGLLVGKVDAFEQREFHLVAAYCEGSRPFSREIAEAVDVIAREENCVSIRFHTCRAAAARLAADEFGYRLTELVMRKTVSPL